MGQCMEGRLFYFKKKKRPPVLQLSPGLCLHTTTQQVLDKLFNKGETIVAGNRNQMMWCFYEHDVFHIILRKHSAFQLPFYSIPYCYENVQISITI